MSWRFAKGLGSFAEVFGTFAKELGTCAEVFGEMPKVHRNALKYWALLNSPKIFEKNVLGFRPKAHK